MGGVMKYFLKKLLGNEEFVKPSAARPHNFFEADKS